MKKRGKIQDWEDVLPDGGVRGGAGDSSMLSPGEGVSSSSGPGGPATSFGTKASPGGGVSSSPGPGGAATSSGAQASTSSKTEEGPKAKRAKTRVVHCLTDIVVRRHDQNAALIYYDQIGPRTIENFRDQCYNLQGRLTDPDINKLTRVRYGYDHWERRHEELWFDLGRSKYNEKNYIVTVDADDYLWNEVF